MAQSSNKLNSNLQKLLLQFLAISSFPLFLERLFSAENHISSQWFHIIAWLVFADLLIVFLLVFFGKITIPKLIFKILLSIASIWMVLLLLMSADRLYGRWNVATSTTNHSIPLYPPNKMVHYQSFEMDFKLQINEYGFRGSNAVQKEKNKTRIACIGDSFTLGWGIEQEQSWPFLLQNKMQENAINTEVLNWGKGGHHPADYYKVAREMIPQWQPDFLIVATLQFEDLFQLALHENLISNKSSQRGGSWLERLRYILFPNITERIEAIPLEENKIDPEWKAQAKRIKQQWPKPAALFFQTLPDTVQQYFNEGQINPWMMDMNMRFPNWTDSLFRPSFDLEELATDYKENMNGIEQLCTEYGVKCIFTTIPFRGTLSSGESEMLKAVGIDFDRDRARDFNDKWNQLIKTKALTVTENDTCMAVQLKSFNKALYYNLDGHFTAAGNRAFLECFYKHIKESIVSYLEKT